MFINNLVPRVLSYPSLRSERWVGERTWEQGWFIDTAIYTFSLNWLQSNAIQDARKQEHWGRERVPCTHPAQA